MKSCRLFCVSSPGELPARHGRFTGHSSQSHYGEMSARHGEISGSGLNNSPGERITRLAKFFSPEPYFCHECSPSARHGEFMQNGPCFAKIIKLP
ncbi:hypothetical protein QL285_009471 [Trifolium repens]|nr:hypothetical protein QL285_009471 [Trifolium repens]